MLDSLYNVINEHGRSMSDRLHGDTDFLLTVSVSLTKALLWCVI